MTKNQKQRKKGRMNIKMIREFGFSGYMFAMIAGFVQEKIGKSLGIEAGVDMKTAYLKARENKIPVSLIDINIKKTLKKLSAIPVTKKISMFSKLFFKGFDKKYRKQLQFDVKGGVPDAKTISKMLKIVEKEIPLLFKILIDDRNKFMGRKLIELSKKHEGNILAVVGAGHLEGMEKFIRKELEKVENKNENPNSISFSFTQDI